MRPDRVERLIMTNRQERAVKDLARVFEVEPADLRGWTFEELFLEADTMVNTRVYWHHWSASELEETIL